MSRRKTLGGQWEILLISTICVSVDASDGLGREVPCTGPMAGFYRPESTTEKSRLSGTQRDSAHSQSLAPAVILRGHPITVDQHRFVTLGPLQCASIDRRGHPTLFLREEGRGGSTSRVGPGLALGSPVPRRAPRQLPSGPQVPNSLFCSLAERRPHDARRPAHSLAPPTTRLPNPGQLGQLARAAEQPEPGQEAGADPGQPRTWTTFLARPPCPSFPLSRSLGPRASSKLAVGWSLTTAYDDREEWLDV